MKRTFATLSAVLAAVCMLAGNVITYTAPYRVPQTVEDRNSGIKEDAFNVSITSHTYDPTTQTGTLTFSGDVTTLGTYAFCGSPITAITLPASVTTIGEDAFLGCTALTSIVLPTAVTTIGKEAFANCNALQTINIPANVTSLGNSAFSECTSLRSISLPDSITVLENNTFFDCSSMTTVVLPSTLTSMGRSVFSGCSNLTTVELPATLTTVGETAFNGAGLTSIHIPATLTDIYYDAFSGCSRVKSITVDAGNTVYDSRDNCNAIVETAINELMRGCETTVIPSTVTSLCTDAFAGCSGLTTIRIPASVVKMLSSVFYKTGLTSITCEGTTPAKVYSDTFDSLDRSMPIYVPEGCVEVYQAADYWSEFTNIQTIPAGLSNSTAEQSTAQKVMYNGKVMIHLSDGSLYDATGKLIINN